MKRIVDLRIEIEDVDDSTPTAEQIKTQVLDDLSDAGFVANAAVLSTEDTL